MLATSESRRAINVYRLCDARPGHEKQTLGLVQGLQSLVPVQVFDIQLYATAGGPFDFAALRRALALARDQPPDLIIGAGHGVHLPMLWLRLRRGGRSVLLMRPSLPASWFDLVMLPEHDARVTARNVLRTQGMLCPVPLSLTVPVPSTVPVPLTADGEGPLPSQQGVILLGGINRYFAWDNERIGRQLQHIVAAAPAINWVISDSRRTPDGFAEGLKLPPNGRFVSWQDTDPNWLTDTLATAQMVWVTADSASMLYEALSAGAQVGVIELPALRANSKLQRGLAGLHERGMVALSTHCARLDVTAQAHPMKESQRCAEALLRRWFPAYLPGLSSS